MKLIDLLVHELPKRGGWPEGAAFSVQSFIDNEIYFYVKNMSEEPHFRFFPCRKIRCEDEVYYKVTREQYEAALAASRQTEWSGEGLPPVGAVIEVKSCHFGWIESKVVAVTRCHLVTEHVGKKGIEASIVHTEIDEYGIATAVSHKSRAFRPARTEAERKRDDAIKQMMACSAVMVEVTAGLIYDAIAAGKIPGIRLE